MLSSGRYRLWLEKDGRRSSTRIVDVNDSPLAATINVVVEGALRPAGPGLTMPMEPFDVEDVQSIARRLGVDRLVVVGTDPDPAARTLTVFRKDGTVVHSDRSSTEHPLITADELVASLPGTSSMSVAPPPGLFQQGATVAGGNHTDAHDGVTGADSIDAGVPWLAIGVGVGAAVVVGAATATVLVLTTTDTVSVRIVDVVQP